MPTPEQVSFLRLDHKAEEALAILGQVGCLLECHGRTRFCHQGNAANQVFLLEDGLVTISTTTDDGNEYYAAYRTPGWILGAASVISGTPYPANLTAHTITKVRVIPAQDFLRLVIEDRRVSNYLHCLHTYELNEQVGKLSSMALYNSSQRLEQFLWQILSDIPPVNGKIQLPFSDVEIAHFVAITPQQLSGIWRDLEERTLVKRAKGWVIVPDRDRLWHQGLP